MTGGGDMTEGNRALLDCGTGGSPSDSGQLSFPQATREYLGQLLNDRICLRRKDASFACTERILEQEISRVVSIMAQDYVSSDSDHSRSLESLGDVVQLCETILIPVDKYPGYNFVGRIIGPRGMTARKVEEETGCKIMIRGRGSTRRGAGREDDEPLHVLIQCSDFESRASEKMAAACSAIKGLLNPPLNGNDELKRRQLMELAIINGTYRSSSATRPFQVNRPAYGAHLPSFNRRRGGAVSPIEQLLRNSSDDHFSYLTQINLSTPQAGQANVMDPDYYTLRADPTLLPVLAEYDRQLSSNGSFNSIPPYHLFAGHRATIPQANNNQSAALLRHLSFL